MFCSSRAVISQISAGPAPCKRGSPQAPHKCVQSAQKQLRQASVGLAAALAALSLSFDAVAANDSLLPLQKLLSPNKEQSYVYEGKQLFNPMAYSGRWYEVASLKKGFAGEGQQDCHCTQGIYVPQEMSEGIKLQVNTFCVHGGPDGRLSGIQGSVTCANPVLLEILPEFKSKLEREEGIVEKCSLVFDSIPFLPAEPYDVIRTDYTTYALVSGATDRSFVQIYSRTPNPGPSFIAEQKAVLGELGYPVDEIVDTPQDCPEMPPSAMMAAMNAGMEGKQLMPASTPPPVAMRGYDLGPVDQATADASPVSGVKFEALRNPVETVKDVLRLLGMAD